ncbi:Do family serine endopeptidase [Fibrobacterota bacterium]
MTWKKYFGIFLISALVTFANAKDKPRPKRGTINLGNGKKVESVEADASRLNTAFVEVTEKVAPSVVSVNTYGRKRGGMPNQELWEYFFGVPFDDYHQREKEPEEEYPMGIGSGFIISKQGHIVTNNHVIENASRVKITLLNKKVYEADVVGRDEKTDIAVLKIDAAASELEVVAFGDSDALKIGEWVLAIGNPFGYDHTVTTGIVSAKGRRQQFSRGRDVYQNFIQTDAAVNPGNSGGPLVNLRGEVMGINTLIVSQSGGYQGLSFTIPIRMAKKVIEDLIFEGKVTRGFIGVLITDVPVDLAQALGLKSKEGCKVDSVIPAGPASKAGLKRNDIILKVGKRKVEDASHLRNIVAELEPNKKYPFKIIREDKSMEIDIKLGARNQEIGGEEAEDKDYSSSSGPNQFHAARLGFKFETVTRENLKQLELPGKTRGAIVTDISNKTLAKELSRGDVLFKYKRKQDKKFKDVKDGKQLFEVIKALKDEESIAFYLYSKGRKKLVALKAKKVK